jgi:radical SAM superfamily enzyme YgiQ (UPF0313 family)
MKRARVLFANAPLQIRSSGISSIPIGQLCIASNIKDIADVRILDMSALNMEGLLDAIREFKPHHIGITLYDLTLRETKETITRIRKEFPDPLITIGGPFATLFPEVSLFQCTPDFVFAGEAERTFREFISLVGTEPSYRIKSRDDDRIRKIAGICFFDSHGDLSSNMERVFLTSDELEELPFDPALVSPMITDRSFPLSTSRGCPFCCFFCTKIHGDNYRAIGAQRIIEILESIAVLCESGQLSPVDTIIFTDDDFARDRKRTIEIVSALEEREFPFTCYIFHASILSFMRMARVDQELVDMLSRSRKWVIKLGTEAFNKKELSRLKKPHREPEKIRKLIEAFHGRGLVTFHYLIASTPWTHFEDFLDNLFNAAECHFSFGCLYDINPYLIPRPGSALFREIMEKNIPHRYRLERVEGLPEYDYPLEIRAEIIDTLVSKTIDSFIARSRRNSHIYKDDPCTYLSMARRILKREIRRAVGSERLMHLKSLEKLWKKRYGKLLENRGMSGRFRMKVPWEHNDTPEAGS